jgi:hypothetical protein
MKPRSAISGEEDKQTVLDGVQSGLEWIDSRKTEKQWSWSSYASFEDDGENLAHVQVAMYSSVEEAVAYLDMIAMNSDDDSYQSDSIEAEGSGLFSTPEAVGRVFDYAQCAEAPKALVPSNSAMEYDENDCSVVIWNNGPFVCWVMGSKAGVEPIFEFSRF